MKHYDMIFGESGGAKPEIKPYPFMAYAPGNYMNDCAHCKKTMTSVDKLCFMCLECAIKSAKQIILDHGTELIEARKEIERLKHQLEAMQNPY